MHLLSPPPQGLGLIHDPVASAPIYLYIKLTIRMAYDPRGAPPHDSRGVGLCYRSWYRVLRCIYGRILNTATMYTLSQ